MVNYSIYNDKEENNIVIGYTSGTFDLFHIGHLNILKRCREQCDKLIVGVNTDQNVISRGKPPCVIPLEQRLEIVKSIKFVDIAFAKDFDDDENQMKSWIDYKYKKSFIGDDYRNSDRYIRYGNALKKVGGGINIFSKNR